MLRRPHSGAPRTPAQRLGAAAAALVLVASGLVAAHHADAVQHAVCAEHGEIIHLSAAAAAPGTVASATAQVRAPLDVERGADHDVCELCATARERVGAPTAVAAAPFASLTPIPAPPTAGDGAGHICRLRLAPKTSPPA
jgi:hypothetical protein